MPDPAVDLARSRTTLIPSESSASGFRRVIEVPPGDGKKKRGGRFKRRQRPEEYRDPYEQGLQVGGPAVENYYPTVPPTTYPSEEIPMQSLGASDPIYGGGGMESGGLSWNERRKIENYAKRVDKDNRRRAKDEASFKEEAEKRAAIEERKRMKEQEKELQAYRKASTHSRWNIFRSPAHTHHPGPPPTTMVTPYSSSNAPGSAWQTYTTGTTPGTAAYPYHPGSGNRPLPAIRSGDTYTALSLPIHPPASTSTAAPGGQALAPFDGYGVRKVGEPGLWTGMSRTMTHAIVGMEHDQYVRSGQRGFIA